MTLDFILKRWFGVSGGLDSGSFRFSTDKGRLLTIAVTSQMKVRSASSFVVKMRSVLL